MRVENNSFGITLGRQNEFFIIYRRDRHERSCPGHAGYHKQPGQCQHHRLQAAAGSVFGNFSPGSGKQWRMVEQPGRIPRGRRPGGHGPAS